MNLSLSRTYTKLSHPNNPLMLTKIKHIFIYHHTLAYIHYIRNKYSKTNNNTINFLKMVHKNSIYHVFSFAPIPRFIFIKREDSIAHGLQPPCPRRTQKVTTLFRRMYNLCAREDDHKQYT